MCPCFLVTSCMQIVKAGTSNKCWETTTQLDTRPYLWDCKDVGNDNQLFGFLVFGDGYQIIAKQSRGCLELVGSFIRLRGCDASRPAQRFWPVSGR